MKGVQVYSSQLTGIFHTIRGERFNNTDTCKCSQIGNNTFRNKKKKQHQQAMVLNIFKKKKSWSTSPVNGNVFNCVYQTCK